MVALTPFILLTSAIGVYASPPQIGWVENYALLKRDTSFPASISTSCVDFYIGQNVGTTAGTAYGQVCVTVDYSTHSLVVKYPTNPGGNLYTDEHVWVGCSPPTGIGCQGNNPPANCDNSDTPGHFPFSKSGGQCTQSADGKDASCTFNIDTILKNCKSCDQSFYIIAHASVTSGTGIGKGTSYGGGNPWWKQYWKPTFICLCTSTITYPAVTYSYTLESTTTVTSTSTTSYETTSTTVLTITTTSSSIYSTTEYSTTTYTSTSTTTSLSESTPKSTATSTCHLS